MPYAMSNAKKFNSKRFSIEKVALKNATWQRCRWLVWFYYLGLPDGQSQAKHDRTH